MQLITCMVTFHYLAVYSVAFYFSVMILLLLWYFHVLWPENLNVELKAEYIPCEDHIQCL